MNANKLFIVGMIVLAASAIAGGIYLTLGGSERDLEESNRSPEESSRESEESQTFDDDSELIPTVNADGERKAIAVSTDDPSDGDSSKESEEEPQGPILGFRGRVVDELGAPVAKAKIQAIKSTVRFFGGESNQAETDQEGFFELEGLEAKKPYRVEVNHPDFLFAHFESATEGEGLKDMEALTIEAGGEVEGTVLGPDGAPLKAARVWLREERKESQGSFNFEFESYRTMARLAQKKVETDEAGRFVMKGVPVDQPMEVCSTSAGCNQGFSEPITVAKREKRTGLVIRLERGQAIAGLVVSDQGPVVGAEVKLSRWGGFFSGTSGKDPEPTETDAQGRFRFEQVGDGQYGIQVKKEGLSAVPLRGGVKPGDDDLMVTMKPMGGVRGLITDSKGPLKGFSLKVKKSSRWGRARDIEDADKNKDGTFSIEDLTPGNYVLIASAQNLAKRESEPFDVVAGQVTEGITINLTPEAAFAGVVVDAKTGEPIAGAKVKAREQKEGQGGQRGLSLAAVEVPQLMDFSFEGRRESNSAVTDEEGKFRLGGLGSGVYDLTVSHDEFVKEVIESQEVREGADPKELRVEMIVGGALVGTVVDRQRMPRVGDRIVATDIDSKESYNAETNVEGQYRIEHMKPGTYRVSRTQASDSEGGFAEGGMVFLRTMSNGSSNEGGRIIDIENDREALCDLSDDELGFLQGQVTFQGSSVEGVEVSLHTQGQPFPLHKKETDRDGQFMIEGIAPGEYSLRAKHPQGIIPTEDTLTIQPGDQSHGLKLAGGTVRGKVRDADGAGIPGVTINLVPISDEAESDLPIFAYQTTITNELNSIDFALDGGISTRSRVQSDENGDYEILYVPPGTYRLEVKSEGLIPNENEPFEIDFDETKSDVDATMTTGATIRGIVRTPDGSPLNRGWVYAKSEKGGRQTPARISPEGTFVIQGLEDGTYELRARSSGRNSDEVPVSVVAGEEYVQDLIVMDGN